MGEYGRETLTFEILFFLIALLFLRRWRRCLLVAAWACVIIFALNALVFRFNHRLRFDTVLLALCCVHSLLLRLNSLLLCFRFGLSLGGSRLGVALALLALRLLLLFFIFFTCTTTLAFLELVDFSVFLR